MRWARKGCQCGLCQPRWLLGNETALRHFRRARTLLWGLLTPEQQETVHRNNYIPVVSDQGIRWQINLNGVTSNCVRVAQYPSGRIRRSHYCALPGLRHPDGWWISLPWPDVWLGQMLAIETNEKAFRKIAIFG